MYICIYIYIHIYIHFDKSFCPYCGLTGMLASKRNHPSHPHFSYCSPRLGFGKGTTKGHHMPSTNITMLGGGIKHGTGTFQQRSIAPIENG